MDRSSSPNHDRMRSRPGGSASLGDGGREASTVASVSSSGRDLFLADPQLFVDVPLSSTPPPPEEEASARRQRQRIAGRGGNSHHQEAGNSSSHYYDLQNSLAGAAVDLELGSNGYLFNGDADDDDDLEMALTFQRLIQESEQLQGFMTAEPALPSTSDFHHTNGTTTVKCPLCNTEHCNDDDEEEEEKDGRRRRRGAAVKVSHEARLVYVDRHTCPICLVAYQDSALVALACGHLVCQDDFEHIGGRIQRGDQPQTTTTCRQESASSTPAIHQSSSNNNNVLSSHNNSANIESNVGPSLEQEDSENHTGPLPGHTTTITGADLEDALGVDAEDMAFLSRLVQRLHDDSLVDEEAQQQSHATDGEEAGSVFLSSLRRVREDAGLVSGEDEESGHNHNNHGSGGGSTNAATAENQSNAEDMLSLPSFVPSWREDIEAIDRAEDDEDSAEGTDDSASPPPHFLGTTAATTMSERLRRHRTPFSSRTQRTLPGRTSASSSNPHQANHQDAASFSLAEFDIQLVMSQASCSRRVAARALEESRGDLLDAIQSCQLEQLLHQNQRRTRTSSSVLGIQSRSSHHDDDEERQQPQPDSLDVDRVMLEASCSRADAMGALREHEGDVVDAIMSFFPPP